MKKYLTMSFDDGTTQDARLAEILRKYNLTATFNINTGLLGAETDLFPLGINARHLRLSENDIKGGLYDGFELAVHTLGHPLLTSLSDEEVKRQIELDRKNIERLTKTSPKGMAYPGGGSDSFDERIIKIAKSVGIKYARTGLTNGTFSPPAEFIKWQATCRITDEDLMTLAKSFAEQKGGIFFVWGHSYELDAEGLWERFEDFCRFMSGSSDVISVTNGEIFNIFGN